MNLPCAFKKCAGLLHFTLLQLTPRQLEDFTSTEKCHICEKDFKDTDKRVTDHDHLTGDYHGPAHNSFNLQYRINPMDVKIPCIIYNLWSYDVHRILSAVKLRHGKISVIPNNTEKYTSFTIGDVTFIDCMQFLMSSMKKLSKNLTDDKLKETLRYFKSDYGVTFKSYLPICFDFISMYFFLWVFIRISVQLLGWNLFLFNFVHMTLL